MIRTSDCRTDYPKDVGIACSKFHQHFTQAFFVPKCFAQLFFLVTFWLCNFLLKEYRRKSGFVIFWRKNFGAKAARKMLMKLTTEFYMQLLHQYSFAKNVKSQSVMT